MLEWGTSLELSPGNYLFFQNLFAKKRSGQAPVSEHNFFLTFVQVFIMILGWKVKSWGLYPKYYSSLKTKPPNPDTPNLKQNADSAIINYN